MTTPKLISEAWAETTEPKLRDQIMSIMMERQLQSAKEGVPIQIWPSGAMEAREKMAGLYPDPADPEFAVRLYKKREFYESRAVAAAIAEGSVDACTSAAAEKAFELTPVQRIVSRFMHPKTPYMGVLINHGVGVGKTCTAVTIAEQFLEANPSKQVIVLLPQALKTNFKNTVFDINKLKWNEASKEWESRQCTGTTYLERLDLLRNPDLQYIKYKTEEDKRKRYHVTGYQAFANWVERTLKQALPTWYGGDAKARQVAEDAVLRDLFSDTLIIVDEAHNLRDVDAEMGASKTEEEAVAGEASDHIAGKALNPYLKRICLSAEGLRLVLMTATPMYNEAPEIVLLLNFLIMNDTKSEKSAMRVWDIFTKEGSLRPGQPTRILERMARRYVTYMRGENPFTFPLRMRPLVAAVDAASLWPEISATRNPVVLTEQDRAVINALPLVFSEPIRGSPPEQLSRQGTSRAAQEVAPGEEAEATTADAMLDARIQMGNITYPNMTYGVTAWKAYFNRQSIDEPMAGGQTRKIRTFSPRVLPEGVFNVDSVFGAEGLRVHAPKIHRIVESVRAARGISFVYSQYIRSGALPLAIALERAGFQRRLADGRIVPLLTDAPPVAPICAICSQPNTAAHAADHPFYPACYVLLTSEPDISPNFPGLVRQATDLSPPEWGPLGANVKVIIGSQVASEGLDLKCVREMHILDPWYHLNRTDQIIGRGIRFCSHAALRGVETRQGLPPMSLNNCLIYMHTLHVPTAGSLEGFETADMYAYRIAITKVQLVGRVQRLLKQYAWDCNLEMEAIIFAGLPPRQQIDAQGTERRSRGEDGALLDGYSINDQDYTTYCDYQVCRHQCAASIAGVTEESLDSSTYAIQDARRQILLKQAVVRRLFDTQIVVPETVIQDIFGDLPWEIASEALMELLDGKQFRLRRPDGVEGFLVKKAGYVVFQPAAVTDQEIPISMRYARAFQLRRQFMEPAEPILGRAMEDVGVSAAVAAAAPAAEVVAEPAAPELESIIDQWNSWLTYVTSNGSTGKAPIQYKIWEFLLPRYAALPMAQAAALQWWFGKRTYAEQRQLLEVALDRAPTDPLAQTVSRDLFRSESVVGYRVYNPTSMVVEYYCKMGGGAAAGGYGTCSSAIQTIMERTLNSPEVRVPDSMGGLFGFLVAKSGRTIFKSLDLSISRKGSTYTGAECGNTSNLKEHYPRVRALQAFARADPALGPLMLADEDDTWDAAGAKKRLADSSLTHMKDLTHQPLCQYMEWLARILDMTHVGGKRWFLSATEAAAARLKGRAGKG